MRPPENRSDADGLVRVLLRMRRLQNLAQTFGRKLLRFLFLRLRRVPAQGERKSVLLKWRGQMEFMLHLIAGNLSFFLGRTSTSFPFFSANFPFTYPPIG